MSVVDKVQGLRRSNAAGVHDHRLPRGVSVRRAIAEYLYPEAAEPKNKHAAWCNIWTHPTAPCNCGAG